MLKLFLLALTEEYHNNIFKAIFQKYVIVSIDAFGIAKHFTDYCLLALQQQP
jgi:hypothetical protein